TKKSPDEGFRRGALEKGAGLGIDGRTEKIGGGRIANVEMNSRIEFGQLNQVGLAEWALFFGRRGGESFGANLRQGPNRFDQGATTAATGNGIRLAMKWPDLRDDLKNRLGGALLEGQHPAVSFVAGVGVG